jgi:formylglycine-generating enzyme required for sulfatase activity
MAGNVWEWTRSLLGKEGLKPKIGYPYSLGEEREDEQWGADIHWVLRGGSLLDSARKARCACRYSYGPDFEYRPCGFRVVVSYADRRDADPGL